MEAPHYGEQAFWNERYRTHTRQEDWYATWKELKPVLDSVINADQFPTILMVGCGNSKLSSNLTSEGFAVTNIDISQVVIENMSRSEPNFEYLVMDATQMPFRDQSFDVVFDKGTYDALISGNQSLSGEELVREMGRVARSMVVLVTYGKPELRSERFQSSLSEWTETVYQCQLSVSAQLANIARSKYPGESLASVLRSATQLQAVLQELMRYMKGEKGEHRDLRQDHCWVYVYRRH